MAEHENGLLAIDVDADDYAEAAAGDTPSVSRTYQSEADFQAVKAGYSAKIDGGNSYRGLIAAVPILADDKTKDAEEDGVLNGNAGVRMSKKDVQLLGYAVGEMYFDRQYGRVIELCERVRGRCEVDGKTMESLERWERRCRERMS